MDPRCDGLPSCEVPSSPSFLTSVDPCPDTEKYLEAHYLCPGLGQAPPTTGLLTLTPQYNYHGKLRQIRDIQGKTNFVPTSL